MACVGKPATQIEGMRHAPFWAGMQANAPTLAYDRAAIGDESSVPTEEPARVRAPTLVMAGGSGAPFMQESAWTLSKMIPHATLRMLDGQTHDVHADAPAPVLAGFFASR
jgi:pimeloyl-ACP methyl ester carboxylesterase